MTQVQKNSKSTGMRGFTLIQVLIGIAITSLVAMFYLQAQGRLHLASRKIETSNNFTDIEGVLNNEMQNFLNNISATGGCLTYATVFTNRTVPSDSPSPPKINFTTSIADSSTFASSGLNSTQISQAIALMNNTPQTAGAVKRCAQPVNPSNPNSLSQNSFYFCLNFDRDTYAAPNSFMASPRAFAEVAVQLVDLTTASPGTSCSNFKSADSGVGAQVNIAIYWLVWGGGEPFYKTHSISYFMGKP